MSKRCGILILVLSVVLLLTACGSKTAPES